MSAEAGWLLALVTPPVAAWGLSWWIGSLERLRRATVGAALVLLGVAAFGFLDTEARSFEVPWPVELGALGGAGILRANALSRPLLVLVSALWLLTVTATPRTSLDRGGLRRTALATLTSLASFLTESPALLVVLSGASAAVFLRSLSAPENHRARHVAAVYLGASVVVLAAGVVLASHRDADGRPTPAADLGPWLIALSALMRKGIFPFHAWIPEVFDRGRLGPAVLLHAPQLGAYVTAVLVVPHAPSAALRIVSILALVTATYAAALALRQHDARRACGYLFVSQSALIMAGLDCTSPDALAGSLVLWISSGLAFAGMARCVLVLEARRGRLDLRRHHGGYDRMPHVAVSFLLMGLACTGFPGTLGFIGEELLVGGTVEALPVLGFSTLVTGALTALAVLRMYFSLFCGSRDRGIRLPLLRREALAFGAIAAFLLATGLAPGRIVTSALAASARILEAREAHGAQAPHARARAPRSAGAQNANVSTMQPVVPEQMLN